MEKTTRGRKIIALFHENPDLIHILRFFACVISMPSAVCEIQKRIT